MIKDISGDLLNCEANILIHSCNCFCTQGAGIALQIRTKYPEAYEADLQTKRGDINKLGTFSQTETKDGKRVFNLYGQYRYGRECRHTDYEAIAKGLNLIHGVLHEMQLDRQNTFIGIPYKMGCNLGGGDWRVVRAIIEAEFENSPFEVLIVKKD
jgi:O-acetyl-ADP-ribose deacetylase (regulator of RNase III)